MDDQEQARNRAKIANDALPVLIGRAGGSVTITRREFAEIAERYGGPSRMYLRMETIAGGEGIRLTLARKEPSQTEPPA